jgi:hypothetical protein
MAQYRFFLVSQNGTPKRGTAAPFPDDERATKFALEAHRGQPAQLWSGDRLIWRYPPEEG